MDALIGTTLGRYTIEALLGEGGMARVYRAHDPAVGRLVALKVVHPRLAVDRAFTERFAREARAVARLQHPHILPIHDFGGQGGLAYLVMPYIAGGTLADWLAHPHSAADVATLLRPIAAALDHAHEQGIIHRDVKPANILLTPAGEPLLADFGIARLLGEATLTATGVGAGSVASMAPEQAQGQPLDGRADLYALGVILYEALTGCLPFPPGAGDTTFSLALRKLSADPPAPTTRNPHLPASLDTVLLRALAKSPAARFPTGGALLAAVSEALGGTAAQIPLGPNDEPMPIAPTRVSSTRRRAPSGVYIPMAPMRVSTITHRKSLRWIVAGIGGGLVVLCLIVVGLVTLRNATSDTRNIRQPSGQATSPLVPTLVQRAAAAPGAPAGGAQVPSFTPTLAGQLPQLVGGQTYRDAQGRFSLILPGSWTRVQAAGAEIAYQSPVSVGAIPATVNIVLEKLPSTTVTLDEYNRAGEANLKQQFPDYRSLELTTVIVDGRAAYKRVYTATIAGHLLQLQ